MVKKAKWTRPKQKPLETQIDAALSKIYYGFGKRGALQNTPSKLLEVARAQLPSRLSKKLNLARIKTFLTRQSSYTVHRRMPKRAFPRRKIRLTHRGMRYDADLVDLQDLAKRNSNQKYILVVIDAFTKYVWAHPLKSKSAEEMKDALESIFTDDGGTPPQLLYTDAGKEFLNAPVQALLHRLQTTHRICAGESYHCPFVERVNRTLKEKLFQAMTATTTQSWVDLLPKVVATYNKTTHSTTKLPPEEITDEHTLEVFKNTYRPKHIPPEEYRFKVGDYVRIAKAQDIFSRGYLPRFTWEIFQIVKRANDRGTNQPPAYVLQDLNGNRIENALFYEPELSRVDPQLVHGKRAVFPIHEVLKRRTVNGRKELLVWWKGWPKAAAEWIPETQVTKSI